MSRAHALAMRAGSLLPVCALCIATAVGAQPADSARYTSALVAGTVHVIQVPGRVMFDNLAASVGVDGVLLIDTGPAGQASDILSVLGGLSRAPVRVLVNTHFHHAGGNARLARGAVVIAHARTRHRMRGETRMYGMMPTPAWPDSALPILTLEDSLTLHFNGERIRLLHVPGAHTDGDLVAIFDSSKVVVTGDIYAPLLAPCDLANGCDWRAYETGVRRLLALTSADSRVIPGHGPVSTRSDLEEFSRMLAEVSAHVRRRAGEGRTLAQIQAEGVPAPWTAWGERGIPAAFFLANVYQGVTGRRE